ncbi:hypothetical protein RVR_4626 [Actinacidiphila reveromycinica]|uniref:Uncharacterized protein n=1 Tax=Actinacidiphila reveromycinica TaxID=659352 RepID=A0A7U3UTF2_9ACTN|nr:hypothetical protein [Streptomyces sp. SN-593]BBA98441.1 hypothetical protein RVR_4626 [Streptomyces sp. SN-593]
MPTAPRHVRAAVDELLASLEPLPYRERMRALAAWARGRAQGDPATAPGLGALLRELDGRGSHGRRLAGVAAVVGRDLAFLEGRLLDPDPAVRRHALKAAARLPLDDDALERALHDAPENARRQLVHAVVASGRTALAERLLPVLREEWDDEEAARLLPACGGATVARMLPELFRAVANWRALGRSHPDEVLAEVARQLAALPRPSRAAWWARNADVFPAVAEARPLRVLDLLDAHCPPQLPLPVRNTVGLLARSAPGRTIRLITASGRGAPPAPGLLSRTALARVARHAPPELADLGRAWSHSQGALADLLRALPPSRREACYDAATAGRDMSRAELSDALLDVLPRSRARTEARRMAQQLERGGAAWNVVLSAVAHLPVAEARPRLLAAVRRPAAEDRAQAYPMLVANAARSHRPAAVAELIDELGRLRNEQEPVRTPALAALAQVPPWLFAGADAAALDRIATDAVEARDSSYGTRHALSRLAVALLREHAVGGGEPLVAFALRTLGRLSGGTGGADLGRLDTVLRRGQEAEVLKVLRPWLESGADRADHSLTLVLAHALGRRARGLPELQELLWRAVRFGNDVTVRGAVALWLDDPGTRDERAVRVLEVEPSAAVLDPVLRVLTRRRTDLLDMLLSDRPPYGRFLTSGTRWLPPTDAADRWLPRQQADAARLLRRAAGDASLPRHRRAHHIRAAAALPDAGLDLVRRHLDATDTVLAEAALGALAWTDRPAEALPILLAHAADDRARGALYAAGRVARFVPPSRLEALLRAALLPAADGTPPPAAKVTSRKEMVRLAATRLPVGTAAAIVAAAYRLDGQHPDVRAACVPLAAGRLLRAPAAWDLLEQAAGGTPATAAAVLRTMPFELAEPERARYARLVARVRDSADPETADAATARLGAWAPWYPGAAEILVAAAVDPDNRTSWRAAADGLVTLASAADGARPLLEALSRLMADDARAAAPDLDAGGERDRPARQRIGHVVSRLSGTVAVVGGRARRAAVRAAGELLAAEGDFVPHGTRLLATALDLDADLNADPDADPGADSAAGRCSGPADALERLAALHTDRPALAVRTAEVLYARLTSARRPGDPLVLLAAVDRLGAAGTRAGTGPAAGTGAAAGHLAVALTRALGARTGWGDDWRARLRALRRHPDPDVRDAALAVATAAE